jgi:DNA-binding FadR family transcriptional regulator
MTRPGSTVGPVKRGDPPHAAGKREPMNDDALIARWQRSGRRDEAIAADIATRIRTGKYKQHQELPPRTALAREFDVSESTVSSAKRLLAAAGILAKDHNGTYTVA